jgi:hypothetical protein
VLIFQDESVMGKQRSLWIDLKGRDVGSRRSQAFGDMRDKGCSPGRVTVGKTSRFAVPRTTVPRADSFCGRAFVTLGTAIATPTAASGPWHEVSR